MLQYRVNYIISYNKLRAIFNIENDNGYIDDLISEVIIIFYKFKELYIELSKCSMKNLCFYAYIGALISIDFEQEKEVLIDLLCEKKDIINIDGFYNFCLNDMRKNWENLAHLAYKLYNQCRCDEDAFELTSFMLGVDGEGDEVIVIDNKDKIKLSKNKKNIPLINLFECEECNIIATLLCHHPTNIVVVNPEKMKPSLMKAIHSLGD